MYQPNVPRKTTALIQVWGCVLLALVCVFLSFAPMITLDTGTSDVTEMIDELDLDIELEIPEKVDVSAVKLVRSIVLVADVIGALSDDSSDADEKVAALEEKLNSEDGANTLVTCLAIANTFTSSIDFDDDMSVGIILGLLITLLALLFVLIFTMICPIIYIITALTMLIPALVHMTNPLSVSTKIAKKLPGLLTLPMVFIVFQCLIPGMNYGKGALGLWVTAAVCVLLNVVVSRLRKYTTKGFVYLTIVQCGALVAAVGYIVYFFNILKTGIFNSFLNGKWAEYVLDLGKQQALAEKAKVSFEPSNAYLIDALLIVVYAILVLTSISYFARCAERLSCAAGNAKTGNARENRIVFAIILFFTYLIPTYVMESKNLFVNFINDKQGASSSLVLTSAQQSALESAKTGLIIMIVAEIAIFVLRLILCRGFKKDDRVAVLTGTAPTPDEIEVKAAPVAEEAVAAAAVETPATVADAPVAEPAKEEAPAAEPAKEEAPAAEPAKEEAPAAEPAKEETPAEEPAKEEVPAEEAPKAE